MKSRRLLKAITLIGILATASPISAQSPSLAGGLGGLGPMSGQNAVTKQEVPVVLPAKVEGASMKDFLAMDAACKQGNSSACLVAGKIMMSDKPPQEIFNLSTGIRANRAIRLYEVAINGGNNLEAMELVYDLYYDKNIVERNLHSYTDKERAKELLDIMISKEYPGGLIRQSRDYIEDPEYLLSLSKKKEACATARSISSRTNISESTKAIANDLLAGNICMVYSK